MSILGLSGGRSAAVSAAPLVGQWRAITGHDEELWGAVTVPSSGCTSANRSQDLRPVSMPVSMVVFTYRAAPTFEGACEGSRPTLEAAAHVQKGGALLETGVRHRYPWWALLQPGLQRIALMPSSRSCRWAW